MKSKIYLAGLSLCLMNLTACAPMQNSSSANNGSILDQIRATITPSISAGTPVENTAGTTTTSVDGLQQQASCHLGHWKISAVNAYQMINKQLTTNQSIHSGETMVYLSMKDAKRVYQTHQTIQFKDKSPFNPDSVAKPGDQFDTYAVLTNIEDGRTFDLVEIPAKLLYKIFPIKPDGFFCPTQFANNYGAYKDLGSFAETGMPIIFQGSPVTSRNVDNPQGRTRAVAVTLLSVSGPIANIQVTLMIDGKLVRTITRGYDAVGGTIDMNGLVLIVQKLGTTLRVKSISEPGNYYAWMSKYFM